MSKRYLLVGKNYNNSDAKKLHFNFIVAASIAAAVFVLAPLASADTFDQQIQNLRNQNAQVQVKDAALEADAADLGAVISNLRAQIASLEASINDNLAKRDDLNAKIAAAEAELVKQRAILGTSIKEMYLEGRMSTFEKLVTSKDLSEYVDKEQATSVVQAKINKSLETINALKAQQVTQRAAVEKLLADQQAMQVLLDTQRAENARLLALNQAQQSELDSSIKNNNAQISNLKRQQAIENAKNFVGTINYSGGSGGYPYANAPFPNAMIDPWGMYQRQCVSYTAWKVASTGRSMPYWGGRGNANQWDDNARAAGIPIDTAPRVGDIAVSNAGTYGHVMYVERVNSDGTIYISQYNAAWDGRYSEGTRTTAGLYFIHFP